MFQFVKQTPELICMNGFSVCFELNNYLKYFFIFVKLTAKNLNSIFSCLFVFFFGVAFSERATISTLVGSATSPPS